MPFTTIVQLLFALLPLLSIGASGCMPLIPFIALPGSYAYLHCPLCTYMVIAMLCTVHAVGPCSTGVLGRTGVPCSVRDGCCWGLCLAAMPAGLFVALQNFKRPLRLGPHSMMATSHWRWVLKGADFVAHGMESLALRLPTLSWP